MDVPSNVLITAEVPRLDALRMQAQEWRMDAGLARGLHSELVGELTQLARDHPWRERFHAQLMLALYRCGRQAEALAAYQRTRRMLVDELGVEPGRELRDLQAASWTPTRPGGPWSRTWPGSSPAPPALARSPAQQPPPGRAQPGETRAAATPARPRTAGAPRSPARAPRCGDARAAARSGQPQPGGTGPGSTGP